MILEENGRDAPVNRHMLDLVRNGEEHAAEEDERRRVDGHVTSCILAWPRWPLVGSDTALDAGHREVPLICSKSEAEIGSVLLSAPPHL